MIFLGYGGNDGSVLGFLEQLTPADIASPLIWCYYEGNDPPSNRVVALVEKLGGVLVPVPGFDRLMITLARALNLPVFGNALTARFDELRARYHRQLARYGKELFTEAAPHDPYGPNQQLFNLLATSPRKLPRPPHT